jgi:hypothetical protein
MVLLLQLLLDVAINQGFIGVENKNESKGKSGE